MSDDFDLCDDCLQPPEACEQCENGSMFIWAEDELHPGDMDCNWDCDNCDELDCSLRGAGHNDLLGMDPDEGPMEYGAASESGPWRIYPATRRECGWSKGEERRFKRQLRARKKRLSAMRRQGRI